MRKQNYEVTFYDEEGMEIKENKYLYTPEAVVWYVGLLPHQTESIKVEAQRDRSTLKITICEETMNIIKDFLMI